MTAIAMSTEGEDAKRLSGEAMPARAEGIARDRLLDIKEVKAVVKIACNRHHIRRRQ